MESQPQKPELGYNLEKCFAPAIVAIYSQNINPI